MHATQKKRKKQIQVLQIKNSKIRPKKRRRFRCRNFLTKGTSIYLPLNDLLHSMMNLVILKVKMKIRQASAQTKRMRFRMRMWIIF